MQHASLKRLLFWVVSDQLYHPDIVGVQQKPDQLMISLVAFWQTGNEQGMNGVGVSRAGRLQPGRDPD